MNVLTNFDLYSLSGWFLGNVHDGRSEEILQRDEENGFEEADESYSPTKMATASYSF